MKHLKTPNEKLERFKMDIYRYYRYYGFEGVSGSIFIRFLPFKKGYDEHPYWLIAKLEYIQSVIENVKISINKK